MCFVYVFRAMLKSRKVKVILIGNFQSLDPDQRQFTPETQENGLEKSSPTRLSRDALEKERENDCKLFQGSPGAGGGRETSCLLSGSYWRNAWFWISQVGYLGPFRTSNSLSCLLSVLGSPILPCLSKLTVLCLICVFVLWFDCLLFVSCSKEKNV